MLNLWRQCIHFKVTIGLLAVTTFVNNIVRRAVSLLQLSCLLYRCQITLLYNWGSMVKTTRQRLLRSSISTGSRDRDLSMESLMPYQPRNSYSTHVETNINVLTSYKRRQTFKFGEYFTVVPYNYFFPFLFRAVNFIFLFIVILSRFSPTIWSDYFVVISRHENFMLVS